MTGLIAGAVLGGLAFLAMLLAVPNPLRDGLWATVNIRARRLKKELTSPIERELELIAGPQRIIDESQVQIQDLRGTLLHEGNVLQLRKDALAAAETAYYRAADDKHDSGVDELVLMVAEKEQEVAIQTRVVEGVQTAVSAACAGVDKARKELRKVQMTVKSDEAKAKATLALDSAARVMEAALSITADGGAFKEASHEVGRQFEAARARLDGLGGTSADRELAGMSSRDEVNGLRARLDAKRAGKSAAVPGTPASPSASPSSPAAEAAAAQVESRS
ncbi:MAG: hypothetical protein KGS72_04105 [Cyanobacteria bacterium REEB67]|nr:hypothetical protein [Cyanobacteria bacterium REEB67]